MRSLADPLTYEASDSPPFSQQRAGDDPRPRKLSPSVAKGLSLSRKLSEGLRLFREYQENSRTGYDLDLIFADIDEYNELVERYAGRSLSNARTFEIGFGARPYRQVVMQSMGVQCYGVDAEVPVLRGHPVEFYAMLWRNGVERAAKTLIRHLAFDRSERSMLRSAMSRRGLVPKLDRSRLIITDVAKLQLAPASLDLVVSEDVFEHIGRATLTQLIPRIASWLRPDGLALIRPNIFTGITGGHLLEWSGASMRRAHFKRRSDPWEHLRRRRFRANTYLNEMTRAEYRNLFRSEFHIVEERVRRPDLGREYVSNEVQRDLTNWSDDELFSNQTLFVLRPR